MKFGCGWRKIFSQKQVQKDAESTFYKLKMYRLHFIETGTKNTEKFRRTEEKRIHT